MTKSTADGEKPQPASRKQRLAQALRDNLKRRKSQARDRKDQGLKDQGKPDSDDAGGTAATGPGRDRPS